MSPPGARSPDSDEALMLAYQRGHVASFEELVRRHQGGVYHFVRRMVGDEALAEEITIDVFFRLHRIAPRWEARGTVRSLIYAIAYRAGIDALRGLRLRRIVALFTRPFQGDEQQDPGASPEESTSHKEWVTLVDRCLEGYPPAQRATFTLYYRNHLTTPEISEALGLPVGTVRAHLSEVRRNIQAELADAAQAPLSRREPCPAVALKE